MQIETIKQTDLTPSEREVLKQDGERWKRIGGGSHLDEWLSFAPGLMIRRTLAMKLVHTNQPIGKLYTDAFNELMRADGLHTMDKASVTAVLWLNDDPERIQILRDMRSAMTPGRRSRMNSPITAQQQVKKILDARDKGGEEKVKESPIAGWKAKVVELEEENAKLKAKLAKAENDTSRFDLQKDSVDMIADVITDPATITFKKAKALADAIIVRLKRKQQKPAG
jgi:transcription antitermination factor NusG